MWFDLFWCDTFELTNSYDDVIGFCGIKVGCGCFSMQFLSRSCRRPTGFYMTKLSPEKTGRSFWLEVWQLPLAPFSSSASFTVFFTMLSVVVLSTTYDAIHAIFLFQKDLIFSSYSVMFLLSSFQHFRSSFPSSQP